MTIKLNNPLASLVADLAKNIDNELFDTLWSLHIRDNDKPMEKLAMIEATMTEILDYVGIESDNDLSTLKEESNDLHNDKNKDGNYFCDMYSEWADSEVSIYNYDLWKEAPILRNYIEESVEEYGIPEKVDLIRIFQQGQYFFYNQLAGQVLSLTKEFIDEQEF